ncbi:MAG: MFS transporter [Muribaculaceae bacterium]
MIQTGKKPIRLLTLLAILSISLVVNLPGLAVTPMLATLSDVFPHTSQLEKQMLTVLPNLLIIPFVLISGKLSLSRHKTAIVVAGLVIFTACAILYLIADSMTELIIISCLLGCGAGLLIPLSSGLIADAFAGKYRMKTMGIKSGISNSSLVIATFVVGWLSHGNWHLPFLVYLISVIPLLLAFRLKGIDTTEPQSTPTGSTSSQPTSQPGVSHGFYVGRIWALIGVYAFITFSCIAITYYCPFLIEKKDWSASFTGTVTAIFYLFMLIPGFTLPFFINIMRKGTFVYCAMLMTVGVALFAFVPETWTMCVGAALIGLGYGICQPLIYDKASVVVTTANKATLSLAFVLAANYLAIVLTPFIIDGLRPLLSHPSSNSTFAFTLCFFLLIGYTVLTFFLRNKFAFSISKDYYGSK